MQGGLVRAQATVHSSLATWIRKKEELRRGEATEAPRRERGSKVNPEMLSWGQQELDRASRGG